ncbi:MAG: hypothetical protein QOJ89_1701, partial [bacterium]
MSERSERSAVSCWSCGAVVVEVGDQPTPSGLVLEFERKHPRVDDQAIYLDEPGEWVLLEHRS